MPVGSDYTYNHSPAADGENKYGYFKGFLRRALIGGNHNPGNKAPNFQGSRAGGATYVTAYTGTDCS